jgi:hypothetical protein
MTREEIMRSHRSIGLTLASLAIAAAAVLPSVVSTDTAEAATYPHKGIVSCGFKPVRGIWVDQPGNSGWAQFEPTNGSWIDVNYYYPLNGSGYRLHVGCGGTAQNWEKTKLTGWYSGSSPNENFMCNPGNNGLCVLI